MPEPTLLLSSAGSKQRAAGAFILTDRARAAPAPKVALGWTHEDRYTRSQRPRYERPCNGALIPTNGEVVRSGMRLTLGLEDEARRIAANAAKLPRLAGRALATFISTHQPNRRETELH